MKLSYGLPKGCDVISRRLHLNFKIQTNDKMHAENCVKYRQKFLYNLSLNKVEFLYQFGILNFTSLTTIVCKSYLIFLSAYQTFSRVKRQKMDGRYNIGTHHKANCGSC